MAAPARDHAYAAQTTATEGWEREPVANDWSEDAAPHIDSPSIASDWPHQGDEPPGANEAISADWTAQEAGAPPHPPSRFGRRAVASGAVAWLRPAAAAIGMSQRLRLPKISINAVCTIMGALVFALVVWRADVVRLMPQTAAFFRAVGLDVNLRGLAIADMKLTSESVNGKPVLVIEGAISAIARKPADLPRLRFIVRDAQGSDIYAWNSVLEQTTLQPGETLWFKSRLASPPAEGREIAVRFFHPRDIAAGGV